MDETAHADDRSPRPKGVDGRGWGVALGALAATLALSGCFSSRAPLIGPADSVKALGEGGIAKRVSYPAMGGGPLAEAVTFAWVQDGYVIADGRGRREPLHYRLAHLKGDWFISQRAEPGGVDYGLARRIGAQLYVYSAQCSDLTDADRAVLNLRLTENGACLVGSMAQLRATMTLVASRGPQPDGYYEVLAPTRP
ncbi:MAG: hypothetical protein KJS97_07125 [Alphaproteobacteria bacterium]|nr:hypothetical protein [Alphaproteobacteria bacterium]